MTTDEKICIVKGIVVLLNMSIQEDNKRLVAQNLHCEQKPLHGADMKLKLMEIEDSDLRKISKAMGL